jgi:hypothetical protein
LQGDPSNARVTAHLGRRLADYALNKDDDPDEARRARGEADFLTSRALKLAPDNDEVKKLREEVINVLQIQERKHRWKELVRHSNQRAMSYHALLFWRHAVWSEAESEKGVVRVSTLGNYCEVSELAHSGRAVSFHVNHVRS